MVHIKLSFLFTLPVKTTENVTLIYINFSSFNTCTVYQKNWPDFSLQRWSRHFENNDTF